MVVWGCVLKPSVSLLSLRCVVQLLCMLVSVQTPSPDWSLVLHYSAFYIFWWTAVPVLCSNQAPDDYRSCLKKILISCISGFLFVSTHRCLLVSVLVTCFVSIWDTCLTLMVVPGLVETAPCIDYSVYGQQISRWYQRLSFFFLLNEGVVVFCLLCCFVKKDIKKIFQKNLLKPFRCNSTFSILVKAHFNMPTSQDHNSVYLQLSIRCCGCKYGLTLLHHLIFLI